MTEQPKENTGANDALKQLTVNEITEIAKRIGSDQNARAIVVQSLVLKLAENASELKNILPTIEAQLPANYAQFLIPIRLGVEVLTDPKLSSKISECSDEIEIMHLIENKLARQTCMEMRRVVSLILLEAHRRK
jgi:hypothetical protein